MTGMDGGDRHGRTVMEARNLSKRFGAITAVDDVSLEIRSGEILAIVGDNGAGKSTLVKMLAGAIRPDAGDIAVEGQVVEFDDPGSARRAGVEMVYQDLALASNIDVAANFMLGRELKKSGLLGTLGVLDRREMGRRTREEMERLRISIPYVRNVPVERMSGGQRQSVAVARAMHWASKVLMMDEPTAALGLAESKAVLGLIAQAAERGMGVAVISHILPHVIELADRIVVLRHGRKVADLVPDESTEHRLVELIVGIEAGEEPYRDNGGTSPPAEALP